MILLVVLLCLIVLIELACVKVHRKSVMDTRVSTLKSTDYSTQRRSKVMAMAQGGAAAFVLVLAAVLKITPIALIVTFLFYAGIRAGTALEDRATAKDSRALRLSKLFVARETSDARFAFYFSAPRPQDIYHVTMWLEALKSVGHKFLVVVREQQHLSEVPVSQEFECVTFAGLPVNQRLLPASCRAVFYANNSMFNIDVIRGNTKMEHVQLLHGDSDKPPSFSPVSKAYNKLFVAGQMAVERYANNNVAVAPERFRIVGRPQIEPQDVTPNNRKTVVYMTTWAGNFEDSNFSSFSQSIKILKTVSERGGVDEIIFKPHPVSQKDPNWESVRTQFFDLARTAKIPVKWAEPEESPFELYAKADVLISDISSTIIDYLHGGKPYIVTNPQGFSDEVLKNYPSVDGGYMCSQNADNVADLVKLALDEDPLAEERERVRQFAFGDLDRPRGEAFREACWEIISKPVKTSDMA